MPTPPVADVSAASFAVLMAFVYVGVLRFIDLNEKEPLWAIGLLVALGACAAALLSATVSSVDLALGMRKAALAETAAMAGAIAVGMAAFAAIGRLRGWREVGDAMDGIVYGAAAGLGFATGRAFIRALSLAQTGSGELGGMFTAPLWAAVIAGLAYGVFGGIIGALWAIASERQSFVARATLVGTGCIAALLANAAYHMLARGNALGGASSVTRLSVALFLPPAILVAIAWYALRQERRAIRRHLLPEIASGILSADDLAALESIGARRKRLWKTLLAGHLELWGVQKLLQNRLVQLALAKHHAARAVSREAHAVAAAEVEQLRATILEIRLLMEDAR